MVLSKHGPTKADVVVAGGGPSGIVAAIAARRAGAAVLLIEQHGFVGGMVTAGLVVDYIGFFTESAEHRPVVRGIPLELLQRLEAQGGARLFDRWTYGQFYSVDPENFKRAVEQFLLSEGVGLLYHGRVVGATAQGSRVLSVTIQCEEGPREVTADVFVDATGDGDLFAAAGVDFEVGRAEDGAMQAVSIGFVISGVNVERASAVTADEMRAAMASFEEAEGWEFPMELIRYKPFPVPDAVALVSTRLHGIDATQSADLTRAEIETREQAHQIGRFLRERIPGFEQSVLMATAPHLGVRETRHLVGEHVLTADDLRSNRRFPDVVALGAWQIELHLPGTKHITREPIPMPGDYDIPYRCLIPRGIDSLLVAGRCVSATHEAAGSLRVMATCAAMGQAAGAAAGLCARRGLRTLDLRAADLQAELLRHGAELGPYWSARGVPAP